MIETKEITGALISDCTKYRYQLWRIWDESKPKVLFIMLNPSTADSETNDPTIRRCIGFAKSWGYGGIYVGNLYAYRSTDRSELNIVENPIGDDNIKNINEMLPKCEKIVCAWGNGEGRPEHIFSNFSNLHYLKLNADGTPAHPLYLSGDLKLKQF
jgi:hypothetical protein